MKLRERLYREALERMSGREREFEMNREELPFELSLYELARITADAGLRQGWLSEDGHENGMIAAAVSGGGDSVALLWLLRTFCPDRVTAAHVNHGIRGDESDGDAYFVYELAKSWRVPILSRIISVPSGKLKGESTETAARRMRRAALDEMAEECGASFTALGHNRDDRAETVLFNILRGTGVRGCAAMPERDGVIIRPLLGMRRGFLREILRVRGIEWREDSTNADTSYTRNFIRLKLLPFIEEHVNARAADHLAELAAEMNERRLDDEARGAKLLDSVISPTDAEHLSISRNAFRDLSAFEMALALRDAGSRLGLPVLSRERISELSRLITAPGDFTFRWCGSADVLGRHNTAVIAVRN